MLKFKNKTVLITGGGSGIGEAMAYQYAKKGCNVILTGRRIETLEKVQKNCIDLGVKAWCKTVDVEKPESIDELVAWVKAEGHLLDFLFLNAGISQRALTLETDISVDRRLMEVNYFGGIYLVKALKDMFLERGVHIGVVSSVSGVLLSGQPAFKHFVVFVPSLLKSAYDIEIDIFSVVLCSIVTFGQAMHRSTQSFEFFVSTV
jgi:NADP-dependent 3-hydroxy acid dehydrogenase YdfG